MRLNILVRLLWGCGATWWGGEWRREHFSSLIQCGSAAFLLHEKCRTFPKLKRVLSLAFVWKSVFYSMRARDKCSLKGLSHMSCHLAIYLIPINYKTVLDFLLFFFPKKSTHDSVPQK